METRASNVPLVFFDYPGKVGRPRAVFTSKKTCRHFSLNFESTVVCRGGLKWNVKHFKHETLATSTLSFPNMNRTFSRGHDEVGFHMKQAALTEILLTLAAGQTNLKECQWKMDEVVKHSRHFPLRGQATLLLKYFCRPEDGLKPYQTTDYQGDKSTAQSNRLQSWKGTTLG